ncbi:MAG: hypothetical protein H0X26_01185 [Alphaproteobacteria bacterium]|nr:hypothetical protein [Alphaproteobacteria bacterium]
MSSYFDPNAFIKEEKQKSFEKKQTLSSGLNPASNNVNNKSALNALDQKVFSVDKTSYGHLMDLFEHKNLAFKDFVKAFENGLSGKMYKNKGGSIRTFQLGKYSFNLHKPHGKKGTAMFYDELRQRAIYNLGILGITKETIRF